ncbi:MAG: hypothetical protein C4530_02865 [Desulfobacteraceae bacterium]|jgi:hypothetical protein|nr:MAG: hypothetical protein C4530_02865 [Desulfobacteraceae bacterium]
MKEIIDHLIVRLNDKDVLPLELPRLIKDVLIIITDGRARTLKNINQNLSVIGWREDVLDSYTFELILQLIETESDYEVVRHTVH